MDNYTFIKEGTDKLKIQIHQPKLDAASVGEFKERLESTWSPSISSVIIDMETVQFIDSSGVGALLSVQRRLPASKGPVILQNAKPNVISVLELLRLQRVFSIRSN